MLIAAILCILAIAGIDQLIKVWIVDNMTLYEDRPFLQIGSLDILHLHFIENTGSAFSSFAGQRVLLLTVTVIGTVAAAVIMVRCRKNRPMAFWCLTAIVGGGLGNMIDRVFRSGRVVDYLDVQLFDFAIFNFADCFVTVGTLVLVVYVLFFMERDDKRIAASRQPAEEAPDDNA